MAKDRKTLMQVAVCVGLLCIIWGVYFLTTRYGMSRIIDVVDDDFSWVHQVESFERMGEEFVVKGFAFELNTDAKEGGFEIVLQDMDSEQNYFPEMSYVNREDVDRYFLCEYDYSSCGYEAIIKSKDFDEGKDYEVFLRVLGERTAYRTGTYISKGKFVYTDPENFKPLDVAGTDIQNVVEQGILRVYRPDLGMYVYQYESDLYWIAEKWYGFKEGDTIIEYNMNTTQIEKLPEKELSKGLFWSNLSFQFTSKELVDGNFGKYRVAKCSLPKEYSLTKIWTGNFYDNKIWRQEFRPFYSFIDE